MRLIVVLLCFVCINGAHSASLSATTDNQQGPKIRAVDRDWSYFSKIPCDEVKQIVFHSDSEEILLAQRKRQCMDKYKAFLSTPVKN